MSNFLKKQNNKIVIIVMTAIITLITAIPGFSLAVTAPVTTPQVIEGTNGRIAGEVKKGTKLKFNITAENGISYIYFQWNRQIGNDKNKNGYEITEADYSQNNFAYTTSTAGYKTIAISGKPTTHDLELTVPNSAVGLLELSIAINDGTSKVSWKNIPYYVVEEYSEVNDQKGPTYTSVNGIDGPISVEKSIAVKPGEPITLTLEDKVSENGERPTGIYFFAYKWRNQPDASYVTGSKKIFTTDEITLTDTPTEEGVYYLQFYISDGSDNSEGWWIRVRVYNDVDAPKDFKVDGPITQYVDLNNPDSNYVIPTVSAFDEGDNKDITAVPNQDQIDALEEAKTNKITGEYKITYTATDSKGNEATYEITIHLTNKSGLENVLEQANGEKDKKDEYKSDTWDKVQEVLDKIENTDIENSTQNDIDNLQKELEEALEGLSKKDEPTFDVQKISLEATYGDNLSNIDLTAITLPKTSEGIEIAGTYTWILEENKTPENTSVENAGINTKYSLKFTPDDTRNYTEKTIPTEITVKPKKLTADEVKEMLNITMPEVPENGFVYDATKAGITATVAPKDGIIGLGTITLKYVDQDGNVVDAAKNAGTYTVKAVITNATNYIFDDAGSKNTEIVLEDKIIEIKKADQVDPAPYLDPAGDAVITATAPTLKTRNEMLEKDIEKITYASSDTTVATVDNTGKITILKTGRTTITVTYGETANYNVKSGTVELNVVLDNNLNETFFKIEASKNTFSFGDTDIKATVTPVGVTEGNEIGTIEIVKYIDKDGNETQNPTNVGNYTVVIKVNAGTKYAEKEITIPVANGTLIIEGIPYEIDTSNLQLDNTTGKYRYNKTAHTPTLDGFNNELVVPKYTYREYSEDGNGKILKPEELVKAGKYTVEVTFELTDAGKANYTSVKTTGEIKKEFEILKREVNVQISQDITSVYGDPVKTDAELTANKDLVTIEGHNAEQGRGLIVGDDLGISLSKEEGTAVKEYAVNGTASNPNYTVNFTVGKYTITKRPVTINSENVTKTYGDDIVPNTELKWKLEAGSTIVPNDTLTGITLTKAEGTDAGEYKISVAVEPNANPNYDVSVVEEANLGKYTINKKVLTEAELKALLNVTYVPAKPENGYIYDENQTITAEVTTTAVKLGNIENIRYFQTKNGKGEPVNGTALTNGAKEAGTYVVKVNITGAENYAFVNEANTSINDVEVGEIVINQAQLDASMFSVSNENGANTFTYGDANIVGTVTANANVVGKIGNITVVGYIDEAGNNVTNPTNAGEYKVVINVAAGTHYAAKQGIVIENGRLKINKKIIDTNTITFSGKNKNEDGKIIYNKAKQEIQPDNLPAEIEITNYDYKDSAINAGTHTVTVTFAPKTNNYKVEPETRDITFVIEKADIDMSGVKFENKEFGYDKLPHSILLDTSTLPEEVEIAGYAGNEKIEPGEYEVTVNFRVKDNTNYNVPAPMKATMSISKGIFNVLGNVNVNANSIKDLIYDGTKHVPTIDNIPAEIQIKKYTFQNSNLSIEEYAADAADLGIINADTYNVTVEFELTDLGKVKYNKIDKKSITFTMTVAKRPVTVVVEPTSSEYGQNTVYINRHLKTESDVIGNDDIVLNLVKAEGTDAKTYDVTGTVGNKNYELILEGEKEAYTITKKAITVKAKDVTAVYGEELKVLDIEVPAGALVNGDKKEDLSVSLSKTGEMVAGTHTITGTVTHKNYDITLTAGTYTINPAPIDVSKITFEGNTANYDATAHNLTAKNVPANVNIAYVYKDSQGNEVNASEVIDSDTYTVDIIYSTDANHSLNATAPATAQTLTISKKQITVAANNVSATYGEALKTLTLNIPDGTLYERDSKEDIVANLSKAGTMDVGSYDITGTASHKNYEITVNKGTYTISPKEITVTAADVTAIYGAEKDTELTLNIPDGVLEDGDTAEDLHVLLTRKPGTDVGTYEITGAQDSTATSNYKVTVTPGTYTINPAPIDVSGITFEGNTANYDGLGHRLTAKNVPANVEITYVYKDEDGNIIKTTVDGKEINAEEVIEAGVYTVEITYSTDKNHILSATSPAETQTLTISKSGYTLDTSKLAFNKKQGTYNGITNKAELTGLTETDLANINITYKYIGEDGTEYSFEEGMLNAGKYKLVAEFTPKNTDNYSAVVPNKFEVENGFTINKRPVNVTLDDKTITYGQTADLTYKVQPNDEKGHGQIGNDVIEITPSREDPDNNNVGTYKITGTPKPNQNYEITIIDGTLTINPAEIDVSGITFENNTAEYNAVGHSLTARNVPANVNIAYVYKDSKGNIVKTTVDGEEVNANEVIDADIYTVEITYSTDANHTLSATSPATAQTLTISKKAITVTANDVSAEYGETIKDLTLNVPAGTLFDRDSANDIVASLTKSGTMDVGNYDITGTATHKNYEITVNKGTYSITAKAITVKAKDVTAVYGEDLKALEIELVNGVLVGEDKISDFTLNLSKAGTMDAGSYDITGTATHKNYEITVNKGIYSITAKAITVKAKDVIATYGEAQKALEIEVADGVLVGEDKITDFTLNLAKSGTMDAGTYDITGTATHRNYTVTVNKGTYTINKKAITVTAADKTAEYGATQDTELTLNIPDGTLVGEDTVADLHVTLTRAEGTNVGTYTITGEQDSTATSNYKVTVNPGTYTILPKEITEAELKEMITVTPDGTNNNNVFVYDENTARTATVTIKDGIVGLGTIAVEYYNGEEKVNEPKDVGTYTIKINITGATNYAFKVSEDQDATSSISGVEVGTIRIEVAGYKIDLTNAKFNRTSAGYNGNKNIAELTGLTEKDLANINITYKYIHENGTEYDIESGMVNAGKYTLVAMFSLKDNANYGAVEPTEFRKENAFVIHKRPVEVTLDNKTVTYGQTAELTYTIQQNDKKGNGQIGNDVIEITPSREDSNNNNVGTYKITGTPVENNNYEITVIDGTYTINPAPIDVSGITFTGNEAEYDGVGHNLTAENVPANVEIAYVYKDSKGNAVKTTVDGEEVNANEVIDADVYSVEITYSTDANHTLSATSPATAQTLTISKKAITLTANDVNAEYGEAIKDLTLNIPAGTLFDRDNANDIVVSLSKAGTMDVGSYDITGTATHKNYEITVNKGTYTITPKSITVTANDATAVYGAEKDSELTLSIPEGVLVGEDTAEDLHIILTREPGTDVGTYAITGFQNSKIKSNYIVTVTPGTYTITPKAIEVKAKDVTATYGEDIKTLEIEVADGVLVGEDKLADFTLNLSKSGTMDAGSYEITGTATHKNYLVTVKPGTYTINKKEIEVTASDVTAIYGAETDTALTLDIPTGVLVGEDTEEDLHVILTREPGTDVGIYAITGFQNSKATSNYTVKVNPGKYTIVPKEITEAELIAMLNITPLAPDNEYEYSETQTRPATVTIKDGIVGLGTISVPTYYKVVDGVEEAGTTDAPKSTGTYTVKVNVTGATNYVFKTAADETAKDSISDVEVTEIKITQTAYVVDLDGIDFDNASLTYTYNGQSQRPVLKDFQDDTVEPVYVYKNADGEVIPETESIKNAGTYTVEVSFEFKDNTQTNYSSITVQNFKYEDSKADYKITQRPVTVTIKADVAKTVYDEPAITDEALTANTSLVTIEKSGSEERGLIEGDTLNYTLAKETGETVGTYDITGTDTDTNYAITFAGETDAYEITPAPITNANVTFDVERLDETLAGEYDTNPRTVIENTIVATLGEKTLENGTDYTYEISYKHIGGAIDAAPTNADTYVATVTITGKGNYDENTTAVGEVEFTINRKAPTANDFVANVEFPITKEYGDAKTEITASVKTGIIGMGDIVGEVKYRETGKTEILDNEPTAIGTYDILINVSRGMNYLADEALKIGSLTINAKSLDDENITVTPIAPVGTNGKLEYALDADGKEIRRTASVKVEMNGELLGAGDYTVKEIVYKKKNESGDFEELTGEKFVTKAGTYQAIITVTGNGNFTGEVTSEPVEFTIEKATPDYTVPTGLTATYGDLLSTVSLNADGKTNWTYNYTDEEMAIKTVGDATNEENGNENGNEFNVIFTPDDTENYKIIDTETVTIMVDRKTPEYTLPTLSATYEQTVADIKAEIDGAVVDLSELGFEFVESAMTSVGNATNEENGNADGNEFHLKYTPGDTANYETIPSIPVKVQVAKAKQVIPTFALNQTVAPAVLMTNKNELKVNVTNAELAKGAIEFTVPTQSPSGINTGDVITINKDTGVITLQGEGIAIIRITFSETSNYKSNYITLNLPVARDTLDRTHFEITNSGKVTYGDSNIKADVVATSTDITEFGEITKRTYYKIDGENVTRVEEADLRDAGTYRVHIDVSGGKNYNDIEDLYVGDFEIKKATHTEMQNIILDTENTRTYNGQEQGINFINKETKQPVELPEGVTANIVYDNAPIDAGTYTVNVTFEDTNSANYNPIDPMSGEFTIGKANIEFNLSELFPRKAETNPTSPVYVYVNDEVLRSLPGNVTVVEYQGNGVLGAGKHKVIAVLKVGDTKNYNEIGKIETEIEITERATLPALVYDGSSLGEQYGSPETAKVVDARSTLKWTKGTANIYKQNGTNWQRVSTDNSSLEYNIEEDGVYRFVLEDSARPGEQVIRYVRKAANSVQVDILTKTSKGKYYGDLDLQIRAINNVKDITITVEDRDANKQYVKVADNISILKNGEKQSSAYTSWNANETVNDGGVNITNGKLVIKQNPDTIRKVTITITTYLGTTVKTNPETISISPKN